MTFGKTPELRGRGREEVARDRPVRLTEPSLFQPAYHRASSRCPRSGAVRPPREGRTGAGPGLHEEERFHGDGDHPTVEQRCLPVDRTLRHVGARPIPHGLRCVQHGIDRRACQFAQRQPSRHAGETSGDVTAVDWRTCIAGGGRAVRCRLRTSPWIFRSVGPEQAGTSFLRPTGSAVRRPCDSLLGLL
jgi:hypothetical protein